MLDSNVLLTQSTFCQSAIPPHVLKIIFHDEKNYFLIKIGPLSISIINVSLNKMNSCCYNNFKLITALTYYASDMKIHQFPKF